MFYLNKSSAIQWTVFVLLLGSMVIGVAWFLEIFIKMPPCEVCLWQRWPYYFALPLTAVTLYMLCKGTNNSKAKILISLIMCAFLLNMVLGIYHTGIEWHWWLRNISPCTTINEIPLNTDSLMTQIENSRFTTCTEASWRLFGISLAGYNVILSMILAVACRMAARSINRAS